MNKKFAVLLALIYVFSISQLAFGQNTNTSATTKTAKHAEKGEERMEQRGESRKHRRHRFHRHRHMRRGNTNANTNR